jgi:m7GpppX diphosphatase
MQLMEETPPMYSSSGVQQYISHETDQPTKKWIHRIIDGEQEVEHVRLRDSDFILLPDTERVNRYWTLFSNTARSAARPFQPWAVKTLNWLTVCTEGGLTSLRELRGRHIPMLERLSKQCLQVIRDETGIPVNEIMVYVHYPPSVWQLHVHFAHPYSQAHHKDVYRIHSLSTIINNLKIDPDYYQKATLQISVQKHSAFSKSMNCSVY